MYHHKTDYFRIISLNWVTLATRASSIPIWNHSFMFASKEEKDAMFNEKLDAAIVIEFFAFINKMWSIKNLLGWCKIKLDQRCGDQLQEDKTMAGLRTEDMLIETDGSLVGQASKHLTAEVVLRMVPEKCPRKTLNSQTLASLPILDSYYYEDDIKKNIEPVYLQPKFKNKTRSPEPIKVNRTPRVVHSPRPNEIIPKVVHSERQNELISTPRQNGNFLNYLKTNVTDFSNVKIRDPDRLLLFQRDDFSEIPIDYRYAFLSYQQPNSTDMEGWVSYYSNLINAYKALVKKMNEDIVLYRQQLRNLELSNNQLSSKMNNFEDKKQALLKLAEINETDKTKLNQSFIELKTRIAIKTNENVVLKDQIDRQRRELERRKDAENEMKKMILAQSSLNNELDLMRQRLSRAYGLEDTVRRQEIVIEKLEAYVKRLNRQRRAEARSSNYFNINNDDFSLEI
ncbi:coiled-coil domain-containing 33-like [Brachionus plicatilis]|uniref:Coiled-coil domain-containing 33-like n=1 Tax=Brachionus plicatilis TaxID=10195 RepID=A0A3M7PHP7_BRAPC|nr:coiled-coil domain-containing 33-like [Brachionus plicatilis]